MGLKIDVEIGGCDSWIEDSDGEKKDLKRIDSIEYVPRLESSYHCRISIPSFSRIGSLNFFFWGFQL